MSARVQALAARLVHDVGKYLARTARNVPAGELDAVLLQMLCRDLYGDAGGPRPSARFRELAAELSPLRPDARLGEVSTCLAELDAIESRVRAGEPAAVARAIATAQAVERLLRALASDCQGRPSRRAK